MKKNQSLAISFITALLMGLSALLYHSNTSQIQKNVSSTKTATKDRSIQEPRPQHGKIFSSSKVAREQASTNNQNSESSQTKKVQNLRLLSNAQLANRLQKLDSDLEEFYQKGIKPSEATQATALFAEYKALEREFYLRINKMKKGTTTPKSKIETEKKLKQFFSSAHELSEKERILKKTELFGKGE